MFCLITSNPVSKGGIMYKPDFTRGEVRLCVLRSLCVSIFLFVCFFIVHSFDNTIWITSLAATTFIAFAFPKAQSVLPRVIIGGYASASVWGVLASLLLSSLGDDYYILLTVSVATVFFTTLTMTLLDIEHPPSAALSIGLVLSDQPLKTALLSLLFVIILSIVKMPLARWVLREHHPNTKKSSK